MKLAPIPLLLLASVSAPVQAQSDRAAQAAMETVEAALQRGHGTTCSLEAVPVARGGYWPCVDIGPYRFVKEYGKTKAFVVLKDSAPYPILSSEGGNAEFLVSGEWTRDLPMRVTEWWEDEVQGGRTKKESAGAADTRRRDAEQAVGRFVSPPPPAVHPRTEQTVPVETAPPPPPPAPVPQTSAAQAGTLQQGDDLRARPIPVAPQAVPPGGVLVAPGVVGYPNGATRR